MVNHDLVLSEPDDTLTIGIVRRQLAEVSQSEAWGVSKALEKSAKDKDPAVSSSKVSKTN